MLVSFETIPCCLSKEEHIAQQIFPRLSDFRVTILRGNRGIGIEIPAVI